MHSKDLVTCNIFTLFLLLQNYFLVWSLMTKECLIRLADRMSLFYLFRAHISNRINFQSLKQKHPSEKEEGFTLRYSMRQVAIMKLCGLSEYEYCDWFFFNCCPESLKRSTHPHSHVKVCVKFMSCSKCSPDYQQTAHQHSLSCWLNVSPVSLPQNTDSDRNTVTKEFFWHLFKYSKLK